MYRFISILYIAFLGAVSCFSPSSTTTILAQPRQYHNLANSLKLNNDSSGGLLQSRLYMSDAAGSYLDSLSTRSGEVGEEEKVCVLRYVCIRYAHFLLHCLSHSLPSLYYSLFNRLAKYSHGQHSYEIIHALYQYYPIISLLISYQDIS